MIGLRISQNPSSPPLYSTPTPAAIRSHPYAPTPLHSLNLYDNVNLPLPLPTTPTIPTLNHPIAPNTHEPEHINIGTHITSRGGPKALLERYRVISDEVSSRFQESSKQYPSKQQSDSAVSSPPKKRRRLSDEDWLEKYAEIELPDLNAILNDREFGLSPDSMSGTSELSPNRVAATTNSGSDVQKGQLQMRGLAFFPCCPKRHSHNQGYTLQQLREYWDMMKIVLRDGMCFHAFYVGSLSGMNRSWIRGSCVSSWGSYVEFGES